RATRRDPKRAPAVASRADPVAEQTRHELPVSETVLRLNLLRDHEVECARLRKEIFALARNLAEAPGVDKQSIRERHREQRLALLRRKREFLEGFEEEALTQLAAGNDVDPARIEPEVTLAQ